MSQKILIVEDNQLNIKYLSLIFDKWNLSYEVAQNGQEALSKCLETSYSIILMDIHMPVKNGFEATLEIRNSKDSRNAHTPIIALSADSVNEQMDRAKQLGMNDFLSKPFIPEEIKTLLEHYLKLQPNPS